MKKIIIFLLLIVTVSRSQACGCGSITGLKDSKSVFKGEVLSVTKFDSEYVRYEILFKVTKSIKGKIKTKKIVVNVSCLDEICCGIPFKPGDRYVIYTFIRNDMLYTGWCTETHKLEVPLNSNGRPLNNFY
jgi:hypothetical protein